MILTLAMEHFLPFRDRIELPLANQGLVLVRGRNMVSEALDSNGCGKSSILHGVSFGLFGEDLVGRKADAVACRFTEETCSVRVDLEDALGAWSVLRTRRPARLLTSGIPGVGENEDMKSVQEKVEQRLGFGIRTFRNAVVFGQGAFERFAHADQAEQLRMLDEIQGVDFREALERAREWRAQLQEKLVETERERQIAEAAIPGKRQAIADMRRLRDRFDEDRKERLRQVSERQIAARGQIADVRAEIERVEREDVPVLVEASRQKTELDALGAELDRLRREADRARAQVVGPERLERLGSEIAVAERSLSEVRASVVQIGVDARDYLALRVEVSEEERLADALAKLSGPFQLAESEAARAVAAVRDLEGRLANLLEEGACPTCRQPVRSRRATLLKLFEPELSSLRNERERCRSGADAVGGEVTAAEAALNSQRAKIGGLVPEGQTASRRLAYLEERCSERAVAQRSAQERHVADLVRRLSEEMAGEERRKQEAADAFDRTTAAVEEAERACGKAVDSLLVLLGEPTFPQAMSVLARLEERCEQRSRQERAKREVEASALLASVDAEREELLRATWGGQDALSVAEAEMSGYEVAALAATSKEGKVRLAITLAEYAVEAFGDRGIRSMLFDGVADYLNERVAENLGVLAAGEATLRMSALTELKKGGVRERISFTPSWAWGGEGADAGSGGQDRRLDLALFAAVQDLAESRSARPFPLKAFDEPFDALDARGKELACGWVRQMARERGTALLMTHSDEIASVAEADRTWTVVMGRDGAHVEVV